MSTSPRDDLQRAIEALDTRIQELKHTLTDIGTFERREDGGTADPRADLQTQLNAVIEERAAKMRELESADGAGSIS